MIKLYIYNLQNQLLDVEIFKSLDRLENILLQYYEHYEIEILLSEKETPTQTNLLRWEYLEVM